MEIIWLITVTNTTSFPQNVANFQVKSNLYVISDTFCVLFLFYFISPERKAKGRKKEHKLCMPSGIRSVLIKFVMSICIKFCGSLYI